MKSKPLIRLLAVLAVALMFGGSALAADDAPVSDAFKELQAALDQDPNISPEVRGALEKFGRAVTAMEDRMVGSGQPLASGELNEKIDEWFNNKERSGKLDKFFGTSSKKGLLERLKLGGSFRLRMESTSNHGSASGDPDDRTRMRYRVRFRFGGEYEIADNAWVGARVTTGSRTDSQSPHQTMEDNFNKWEINFDQIYLHWAPFNSRPVQLGGTKFTSDIWLGKFAHKGAFVFTPFMWDDDVNPEGIAIKNTFKGLGFIDELQLNLACYVLTEDDEQQDAAMGVIQLVLKKKVDLGLSAPLEFTAASAVYKVHDTATNANTSSIIAEGGVMNPPTLDSSGNFQSNYVIWDNILEMKYTGIEFLGKKRPLKVTFNYIYNTNSHNDAVHGEGKQNKAYALMASFGEAKKKGDWSVGMAYAYIERDAVYAPVTTDDFPSIGNIRGTWAYFDYAVWDNATVRLWGLWDSPINDYGSDDQDNHFRFRVQFDVKF